MKSCYNEPKTRRGQLTMKKILDSANKLFCEKGYYNTSINDITDGANIAPGTFYIYFCDKYNLYKYLLLDYSYRIRKAISLATKHCKTRYETEAVGLKTFLEFVYENKYAYKIIWESQYVDYELFKDYYESFASRYVKGILESQNNGEVRDIDPTTLSYVLMGIANFIGLKWVVYDQKDSYDDVVSHVMDILSHGMFK